MGWKNVKEHYRIVHAVQVTEEGICIGSPYVHNLIVIGLDGRLVRRPDNSCNEDLIRYQQEMDADTELLRRLIESPDQFDESKTCTVWTYDNAEIIEKKVEGEPKWPNVTHDGEMIFENTFSTDRETVVQFALRNAEAWLEHLRHKEQELKKSLEKVTADVIRRTRDLVLLRDEAES